METFNNLKAHTSDCSGSLLSDACNKENYSPLKQQPLGDPGTLAANEKLVKASVLPAVDLTGFNQPGTDKTSGPKTLLNKVKGFFGHSETLGDQVHDKVLKNLNPNERKKFDDEKGKIEKYEKDFHAWASSTIIPAPSPPEKPATPEHDEVQRRTNEAERKIDEDVRNHMSSADRDRLDMQMEDYKKAMERATRITNREGTGEGRDPKPEPGNAIKDFWDRVKEATEAYTN